MPLLFWLACAKHPAPPPPLTDVDKLEAFSKLYRRVRFWMPSDAAAEADWNAIRDEVLEAALAWVRGS